MVQIRCKKCGREVNKKDKYCPVCGNLIKKNIFTRAVLFIIAVSIIFYIYPKLINKTDENTQVKYSDPAFSITASRLYNIYEQNEPAADKKFKGKVVSVSGEISSIGKDMIGKFNICLKTKNSICGIQCFFDKAHKKNVVAQEKGAYITITGRCDGKTGRVILRKCVF
jgi:putative nucleic acid binding protein